MLLRILFRPEKEQTFLVQLFIIVQVRIVVFIALDAASCSSMKVVT